MMQTYEHYKDSGIDWIGQIPEHWNEIKIKNLFTEPTSKFIDGDWIESKDINSNDIYYFTTGNIQELKFKETEKSFISIETFQRLNCTEVLDGDILVSRLNVPLGRCCIFTGYDKKSIVSVDVVIFRPDEFYNRKYLVYVMNSPLYFSNTENIARGAIMKRISRTILGNIKIPIPPIQEQEAIANFLDEKTAKIDALVQTKEQQIEKLKELRQIKIHQAVTKGLDANAPTKDSGVEWIGEIPEHWELKKVKEICTMNGRIGFRGYSQSDLVSEGEGAITISPSNIVENQMFFEKNTYLSWEKYFESPEIMVSNDDILIVKTGSTVGKVGIVKNLDIEATINPQILVIKNIKANIQFTYEYLHSNIFYDFVKSNAIGSTIPTISETKIGNLPFINPPIQEQEQIVAYLDEVTGKIDQAIAQKQEQITQLKEYKQSLINDVVTGKVRVG